MLNPASITLARSQADYCLLTKFGNRHGLIAGLTTGTGKTVSLQVLAEGFSARGVPVFMADVKGDLAGMSQPAQISRKVDRALKFARGRWLYAIGKPGGVLGYFRQKRTCAAQHDFGNGADFAGAGVGAE